MKKIIGLVFITFELLTILLSGCAPVSTPVPTATATPSPPLSEDSTWQVRIEKIEDFVDPRGLVCSDCGQLDVLRPADGYTFLIVTGNVLNKTNDTQAVTTFRFGITTSAGSDDCGYRAEDSNICLLSALNLGGKMHVNIGVMAILDFSESFKIAPNSPGGELVEFYFITKTGAKAVDFYFDNLSPINISALNP